MLVMSIIRIIIRSIVRITIRILYEVINMRRSDRLSDFRV